MILEMTKFVLPTDCWPGGSKSSGEIVPFKPSNRLDDNVFPQ
jgi:hypothetical protein